MKKSHHACRYVCGSLAVVTAAASWTPLTVYAANASSSNFDMRQQVVSLTGIMDVTSFREEVTRGDFARMLVNASSYRENLPTVAVSVFADVPATNPNAIYIRIAASQGWMTGYLGGLFKPDESVSYKDAVKAMLTMLGYTDDDFVGDLSTSRLSKFNDLELNENVNRSLEDKLNQTDCMNLFYNLLKANPKDETGIYGAILDCELTSDGEINPIGILEDERKGPILVRSGFSMAESVPFDTDDANVFLNGTASSLEEVKTAQQNAGFAVVYYNVKSKTIWAYTTTDWDEDDYVGNNTYVLIKGEIKNIYYQSTDVMTPTSIRIEVDSQNTDDIYESVEPDSDGYYTITLDSAELQYMFSIYGVLEVGDEVVLVCNYDNGSFTAVDAIEY